MSVGPNVPYTDLDHKQTITQAFVESQDAHRVINVGGGFITSSYTEIDLTYVPSGNGVGQIQTVTYKNGSIVLNTLTLSYDGSNNLISVVKT